MKPVEPSAGVIRVALSGDVENTMSFVGIGGPSPTLNAGRIFVTLKPLAERKVSADQVVARLRDKLAHEPGANLFLVPVQDIRIGGRQANAQYQYTIQSENLEDLINWGPVLLQQMKKVPVVTDVSSDQQNSGLQASLVYDRATASRMAPPTRWTTRGEHPGTASTSSRECGRAAARATSAS